MADGGNLFLTIVGSGGLSAIVLGGIGYLQRRSDRNAAAPKDTVETNTLVINQIVEQNKRLVAEAATDRAAHAVDRAEWAEWRTKAEERIDELEARDEARDVLWKAHTVWDDEAAKVAEMAHVSLAPRPPLTLPPLRKEAS